LPLDLPDHIDVDVTNLDIGDSIKIRDLKVAEEITILDRPDSAVAAVAIIKVVKEPVKEEVAVEEGAATDATEKAEKAPAGATAAPAEKGKAAPAEKGK
jgi:large subunit ribosomal protein L25